MARITVEDCLKVVPNKYKLVILASERANELFSGIVKKIETNDTDAVTALREIALSKVDPEKLEEKIINSYRRISHIKDPEIGTDEEVESELEAIKKEMEGLVQSEEVMNEAGFHVE